MLLPTETKKTRDLRSSPIAPECKIGSRVPLYTVVETKDPGVYGPFFFDPAAAVLFSFYKHLSNGHFHCAPGKPSVQTPKELQPGTRIPNWFFSSDDYSLLEVRSNSELVYESKLIDSNIDKYVEYKFGKHNPSTRRTNVNLDKTTESADLKAFIGDQKWNAARKPDVSQYSTLCMIDPFIFESNRWLIQTDLHTVDYKRTLCNFDRYLTLLTSAADKERLKTFTHIQETAICVVKPQEIFDERCLYTIDWEGVWIHFLNLRAQNVPVHLIRTGFQGNPNLFLTKKELLPTTTVALNGTVCLHLVAHCHSLRDVSAFFSTNRFYRRVYSSFSIQQIILRRFLPSWSECFTVLPDQTAVERQYIMGSPRKEIDQGWWAVSSAIFSEDLPELGVDEGTTAASELQRPDPEPAEKPKADNTPYSFRRRRVRAEQVKELAQKEQDTEELKRLTFIDYPRLEIPDHQLIQIVRSCNSFLSTVCLIYTGTMTTNFQETCVLGVRIRDDPPYVVSTKKIASPPAKPRSLNQIADFFDRTPLVPEYSHTITCFSTKGTWVHQFPHPFFQDLAFVDMLTRFKSLSTYSCSLRSKFHQLDRATVEVLHQKEKRDWTARRQPINDYEARLDFRTQLLLYDTSGSHVLSIVFQRNIVPPHNYTMFFCFPGVDMCEESSGPARREILDFVESAKTHYFSGTEDMMVVTPIFWNLDYFDILKPGERLESTHMALSIRLNYPSDKITPDIHNSFFYTNYMVGCCLLRLYIREKAVTRGEWRVNF